MQSNVTAPSPSVGILKCKTIELQVAEKASLAERRANALAGAAFTFFLVKNQLNYQANIGH